MKKFYQDGREFYDAATGVVIASYPDLVKNDHDVEGAQEARKRFMQEHPDYEPVADPFNMDDGQKYVSVLDVARARGVKEDERGCINAAEFDRVGMPFMGGCQGCHASIAAYNAFPSKTGFLQCRDCIEGIGFASVEEFENAEAAEPSEGSPPYDAATATGMYDHD